METVETSIHHHSEDSQRMAQHTTRTKSGRYCTSTGTRTATLKTGQGTITRSARSLRLVEPSGDA
ncbi:hypothetical protein T05_15114 [Trichinella murrelli]|nr:hypothetical protein T05_15114 [Trichinella murrelli]